jgi:hypothetical protein
MSRTDTAVRVMSASPDRVFAPLSDSEALAVWLPPDGRPAGSSTSMRVPAGPTDWSWRTRTRRPRGKSAVDSDGQRQGGHPVDARSRGDIWADDVPDGIKRCRPTRRDCRPRWTISPLPLDAERRLPRSHGARRYGEHPCRSNGASDLPSPTAASRGLHAPHSDPWVLAVIATRGCWGFAEGAVREVVCGAALRGELLPRGRFRAWIASA